MDEKTCAGLPMNGQPPERTPTEGDECLTKLGSNRLMTQTQAKKISKKKK